MKFQVSRTTQKAPPEESVLVKGEYFINIDTLDDLINFRKKYGYLILHESGHIEIYDDHRE